MFVFMYMFVHLFAFVFMFVFKLVCLFMFVYICVCLSARVFMFVFVFHYRGHTISGKFCVYSMLLPVAFLYLKPDKLMEFLFSGSRNNLGLCYHLSIIGKN